MKKYHIILLMSLYVFFNADVNGMVPTLFERSTGAVSKELTKKYSSKLTVEGFDTIYAHISEYLHQTPDEVVDSVCDSFCSHHGWLKQPHNEHVLLEKSVGKTEISFSRCNTFASLSSETHVHLWDLNTFLKRSLPTLHRGKMNSIALSPDGNLIAVGMQDGKIYFYNCEVGMWSGQPIVAHLSAVTSLCFSPDCRTLVSGSNDQIVELWDVETGQVSSKRKMMPSVVSTVSFSPRGREIGVGLRNKSVSLYPVNDDVSAASFKGCVSNNFGALTFDRNGSVVASGGDDGVIHFLNIGQQREEDRKLSTHKTDIVSVTFSPEGNLLASSSSDDMVRLWDVNRREYVRKLIRDKDDIGDGDEHEVVCFSSDGRSLISAGHVIKLWQRDNFETALCKIALLNSSHSKKVRCQLYKRIAAQGEDFINYIDPDFLSYLKA